MKIIGNLTPFFDAQIKSIILPIPKKIFRVRDLFGDIWDYIDSPNRARIGKAFDKHISSTYPSDFKKIGLDSDNVTVYCKK